MSSHGRNITAVSQIIREQSQVINTSTSTSTSTLESGDNNVDNNTNITSTQEPKKSREEWRKAKELEEARKAGTAPAAVDEHGRDINPHIPQYISSAPWYYGTHGPTLKHQRPQEEKERHFTHLSEYYKKGVDKSSKATKYRKGACENCGAMTHKKKDCLERPRKIGAKYTNDDIAPDEFVQPDLNLSFDGKRDRWNGYDASEHAAIIEEYQKIEDAKREMRAERLEQDPSAVDNEEDDEQDEDKYVDGVDMPGTKVDSKQRITVRNLRIREDTAKYLRNLDPNSAYYDPKTRSMRDNPNPASETDYSGENFVRFSGDTQKHAVAQLFAWEAHDKGVDVHLLAEPTKLEILQKEYDKKKEQFKSQVKDSILDKYGGEEHLKAPPKALLLAQTEVFTQYNRDGTILQGQEKQVARSKYEEDVLINNHTTVWGSFWKAGKWGYKCCYSFIKMSYCVGEAGKSVILEADTPSMTAVKIEKEPVVAAVKEQKDDSDDDKKSSSSSSSSSSESEDESSIRSKTEKSAKSKNRKKDKKKKRKELKKLESKEQKLQKALKAEEAGKLRAKLFNDDRKRPYNSMVEVSKPTDEEMEAYFMKKRRDDDPMNQFVL